MGKHVAHGDDAQLTGEQSGTRFAHAWDELDAVVEIVSHNTKIEKSSVCALRREKVF